MKSLVRRKDVPLWVEEVAVEMRRSSCDGYIVVAHWIWLFEQAFAMAWGEKRIPKYFVMPSSYSTDYSHLITIDTDHAIEQAVRIFTDQGNEHIAMLDIDIEDFRPRKDVEQLFSLTCTKFGIKDLPLKVVSRDNISKYTKAAMEHLLPMKNSWTQYM